MLDSNDPLCRSTSDSTQWGLDLGARRVLGELGNLLGLLSPAPSDVTSEFCARGEPEASRCSLTCCHKAGEAGLKSTVLVSLCSVHEIMRAIC